MEFLKGIYIFKREMMKTSIKIVPLILVFLFLCCTPKPPVVTSIPAGDKEFKLTILHFNDLHGHLNPEDSKGGMIGGVARLAAKIDEIRTEKQNQGIPVLVLFGGDIQTGTRINEHYKGIASRDLLNQMKVSAAVIGNHEFDYGFEKFVEVTSESDFPWLAGNVRLREPVKNVEHLSLMSLNTGLRVGIVGVTTDETEGDGRTVFKPATALIQAADEKSDALILLSHSGKDCDRYMADRFGPVIDLIVGGHNHALLSPTGKEGDEAPIVQAGSYGHYLGQADLTIKEDRVTNLNYKLHTIDNTIAEDNQIAAMVEKLEENMPVNEKKIIGNALVRLDGDREIIRREESNLGDFVCDLVRTQFVANADVAILNSGGFRASIHKGPITEQDIKDVFPFGNSLSYVDVTGEELFRALNSLVDGNPDDDPGHFPQVSGVRFEIDGRVVKESSITVGGNPLNLSKTYRLVINDFMAKGEKDHYVFSELSNKPALVTQYQKGYKKDSLANLIIQYIEKTGNITQATNGRISRIANWEAVPGEIAPCWENQPAEEEGKTDKAA